MIGSTPSKSYLTFNTLQIRYTTIVDGPQSIYKVERYTKECVLFKTSLWCPDFVMFLDFIAR